MHQVIYQEGKGAVAEGKGKLAGAALSDVRVQEKTLSKKRPAIRNFSEPSDRRQSAHTEEGTAHVASALQIRQVEKPTVYHSPTSPGSPKPSKTGLRMPSESSSLSRIRGASVVTPHPPLKSALVEPQPSRPATAGGESVSKPTGKRRPSAKVAQLDGAFPFSTFRDLPQVPQRPWQAEYSNDKVRSSLRSALTTTSSHIDVTSTERSSVMTKDSSIIGSMADPHSRPHSKSNSMTVDDAIDMYAAGFADDDEPDTGESRDTSISEEERRRSMRIAEAINESMWGMTAPLQTSNTKTAHPPAVAPGASNHAHNRGTFVPPCITAPTVDRDQYGFLKANHHITTEQFDTWNAAYLPDQERRCKRWMTYMQDQGLSSAAPTRFPGRSNKTERFIRKGIPPAWRGPAWFFYAGGDAYLERHAGLYSYLVTRSEAKLPNTDKEAIERDINRTFPDNIHFKPDTKQSTAPGEELPILTSLRRVLRAFAFHSPRIGYCQSLNFLTGLLLLFLPEEKAFWMLHIITTVNLPGTHEISLEGANVDLWVLMIALKSSMPSIWTKVGAAGTPADGLDNSARLPPISLCTTSWFMSLFIGTLPIESVLRVWDVLFYEGSRTLFRVALTIFKLGEQRIKKVGDSMELFQVVQSLPREMLDASALMMAVCRRGAVSTEWIEARRWERREWYSKERARALVSVDEGVRNEYFAMKGDGGGQKSDSEEMKRKGSVWRRKRKGSVPEKKVSPKVQQLQDGSSVVSSPVEGVSREGRELLAI